MLFGKKENKAELPDLPPLPALPSRNVQPAQQPSMPVFPDSPEKKQAREGMDGMIEPPGRQDAFVHGPQPIDEKKVKVVEMEEWHPQNLRFGAPAPRSSEHRELREVSGKYGTEMPKLSHMPELPHEEVEDYEELEEEPRPRELQGLPQSKRLYVHRRPSEHHLAIQPQQQADVFVRIDKFHSARKSLSEIQNRLDDIDELIRRIKDTKLKEEQELAGWERDLMQVKSRIQTVTENIFEKVE
ncbi:MAG: hypothetical protein KKD18_02905 [Nanoarchaeota archaeon]|nr:hypothetical protein [Nanoarchaeota archaeon]MBU0977339.1 hypothetical protein [Nanoarchaeota archaeon]